jgi:hypothetical protein
LDSHAFIFQLDVPTLDMSYTRSPHAHPKTHPDFVCPLPWPLPTASLTRQPSKLESLTSKVHFTPLLCQQEVQVWDKSLLCLLVHSPTKSFFIAFIALWSELFFVTSFLPTRMQALPLLEIVLPPGPCMPALCLPL